MTIDNSVILFAVLVCLLVAAIVGAAIYFTRPIEGKVKVPETPCPDKGDEPVEPSEEFKLTQQEFLMNELGTLAEAVSMGFNNPLLHRNVFRNMMIEARIFIANKEDDIPF